MSAEVPEENPTAVEIPKDNFRVQMNYNPEFLYTLLTRNNKSHKVNLDHNWGAVSEQGYDVFGAIAVSIEGELKAKLETGWQDRTQKVFRLGATLYIGESSRIYNFASRGEALEDYPTPSKPIKEVLWNRGLLRDDQKVSDVLNNLSEKNLHELLEVLIESGLPLKRQFLTPDKENEMKPIFRDAKKRHHLSRIQRVLLLGDINTVQGDGGTSRLIVQNIPPYPELKLFGYDWEWRSSFGFDNKYWGEVLEQAKQRSIGFTVPNFYEDIGGNPQIIQNRLLDLSIILEKIIRAFYKSEGKSLPTQNLVFEPDISAKEKVEQYLATCSYCNNHYSIVSGPECPGCGASVPMFS